METLGGIFSDIEKQVRYQLYGIEAAVAQIVPSTTQKRPSTAREPCMRVTPIPESWNLDEEQLCGTWWYNDDHYFEISRSPDGRIWFLEGPRRGELVVTSDSDGSDDWLIASLEVACSTVGTIKLKYRLGKMLTQYKSSRSSAWGSVEHAVRDECSESDSDASWHGIQDGCRVFSPFGPVCAHPSSSSTSKPQSESRGCSSDECDSGPRLRMAKAAVPQELQFIAPEDAEPGKTVCLAGPHGDPIRMALPEGVQPGKLCSIYLGPTEKHKVVIPEDKHPGTVITFEVEGGGTLKAVVPEGKKPGDTLEIVPPVLLIQVPPGAKPLDEIVYQTPAGSFASVVVPPDFWPGNYFSTMLPATTEAEDETPSRGGFAPARAPDAAAQPPLVDIDCDATAQPPLLDIECNRPTDTMAASSRQVDTVVNIDDLITPDRKQCTI